MPCPINIFGWLSSSKEIQLISSELGSIGIAGGSYFVFREQYKAVLPYYIDHAEKLKLLL